MSTAKLVMWLHWQLTWLWFRNTTSQPRADQPPAPPALRAQHRGARHGGGDAPGWGHRRGHPVLGKPRAGDTLC